MKKTILDTILDPRELSVCFQPIFRVKDGVKQIEGVEGLVRGPKGTHFSRADILFDYVRRKRAEAAVDESCCIAICNAAMGLPRDIRININVHGATLGHRAGFVEFFRQQVKRCRLDLERFTLEIVEHAPACNVPELINSVNELRASGARIALDDVGLGQSNYRMILDCNPNYFKLDAYFVRGLNEDPKRRAVVESLVALAKALGSAVVAEGAATEQDIYRLSTLGVDLIQANILCAAMPLEELKKTGHLGDPLTLTKDISANQAVDAQYQRMHMHIVAGQSIYT